MTYSHLQADCLYTGISSGPSARKPFFVYSWTLLLQDGSNFTDKNCHSPSPFVGLMCCYAFVTRQCRAVGEGSMF